ncbi:MAG: branched-chain amino acid ABC transporter permease [Micromonosporaceae bacterium]|nr:branched-chain amino acid ABC transporter permease [Micromonosporaceae bacterium]
MQDLVSGIALGSTYVLLAIGLSMIYGILRIIHVAHAGVYVIGAWAGYLVWRSTGSLLLAVIAGAVAGAVAGVAVLQLVYRPMLDKPRYVPLIASVGVFILVADLMAKPWLLGPNPHQMNVKPPLPALRVGDIGVSGTALFVVLTAALLLVMLWLVFSRTQVGLRWQAIAADRELAGASGIDVNRAVLSNFAFGSALAGAAGVAYAAYTGSVFATMGDVPSYKAFVVVVLGGLGNVWGTVVAGFGLALLETLLIANFGYLLPRDALAFIVLILVLMVRPRGLFGRAVA